MRIDHDIFFDGHVMGLRHCDTRISSPIAPNVKCIITMPPINNPLPYEVRKVQNTSHLAMISVPKRFADSMRIQKGSLVKIQYDKAAGILIISKVHIDGDDGDGSSSVQIPS